jgi:hypothetical protein
MARRPAPAATLLAGVPRVNLMPRAELDRRERAIAVRRWGWGVVGALAVVVVASGAAFAVNWFAKQDLAAAQSRTTTVSGQLAALSDVSTAIATRADLEGFRSQAMGADIDYLKTLTGLGSVLPDGVGITGFDLISGGIPVTGSDPKAQQGLVGTITLESANPVEIVPVIRSFRKVPGVIAADGHDVTSKDTTGAGGPYTYTVTISFDQTVYTGKYAKDGTN